MAQDNISILSIAPYKILPATSGGKLAITKLHHYLGKICRDNVVSTLDNESNSNSFRLYKLFTESPLRYFPGYGLNRMFQIAEKADVTHIICEHPYMSITAMTLAHKLDVPWFLRSHNIESQRFRELKKPWWPALRKYERYTMQQADGTFFITPEDANWAEQNFKIKKNKCHVIPFGTDIQAPPPINKNRKQHLAKEYNLNPNATWLYFLGALDYIPNEDAVKAILKNILPLLKKSNLDFEVIIAGKSLNKQLVSEINTTNHIHYTGFIENLNEFLNACDIMLNPMTKGGGIKTKAVEAIAYNNSVISTENGAAGLDREACGEKLLISHNNDFSSFVNNIESATKKVINTPASFYEKYYHGNIAHKALSILKSVR